MRWDYCYMLDFGNYLSSDYKNYLLRNYSTDQSITASSRPKPYFL